MTENDIYYIGDRVRDIDPDLSIVWDKVGRTHRVFWKGKFVMNNPYSQLDGRLLTRIRQIDAWNGQWNPGREIAESEEYHRRSNEKLTDNVAQECSKEALRAVKHDLGVA